VPHDKDFIFYFLRIESIKDQMEIDNFDRINLIYRNKNTQNICMGNKSFFMNYIDGIEIENMYIWYINTSGEFNQCVSYGCNKFSICKGCMTLYQNNVFHPKC
jgi:hypothetical protein